MLSIINILALALAASGALASDVFATFYSDEGQIAPNFDVSNTGCFAADSATRVSFSQDANGPYCLSAWIDAACPGTVNAKQPFSSLTAGTQYSLDSDVAFSGSFEWSPNGC